MVWRQTTESFIRCLENAFRYFGGVPKTLVIDNLRAAVTRADWFDPELNAKVAEFCRHYGTAMLPTRPAMPQHKGKIEAGVKFAQNNALKGRSFPSLAEQNLFLTEWESGVADTRIHGTTRQQVGKVFNEVERPKLSPLPAGLFPVFEEAPRTVHQDGYIELQRAYYSVPPEYVGRQVWARWESRLVRVFNQRREVIAVHVRVEPGKFATDRNHLHSPYRRVVEHGQAYLLDRARLIGAHTGSWAEGMVQQRGPIGVRVLHGLLALAQKHPVKALENAAAKSAASRHVALARPAHVAGTSRAGAATGLSGNPPADPQSRYLPGLCARLLCSLNPQPQLPSHHEYCQPRNHPERTPPLRPVPNPRRPAPGSRRQPAGPRRVFGTHPARRTQRPPATPVGTPHQGRRLPPP